MITTTLKLVLSATILLYGVGLPVATLITVQADAGLSPIEQAFMGSKTACEHIKSGKTYFDLVFPVRTLACLLETPVK
mgnify:CR=1 FL=1